MHFRFKAYTRYSYSVVAKETNQFVRFLELFKSLTRNYKWTATKQRTILILTCTAQFKKQLFCPGPLSNPLVAAIGAEIIWRVICIWYGP